MDEPLIYQVTQLLRLTKINFDKEELAFQIQSHPSFPSLHAITGVLEHFNINNLAVEVPKTEEVLVQLPPVFLAQIALDGDNEFATIVNKGQKIDALISSKRKETFTVAEFLEKFTGVIVAIEKDEDAPVLKKKNNIPKTVLSVITGILILTLLFLSHTDVTQILYLILAFAGVLISGIILKKDFGLQTDIGDALCSGANEKTDCNTVLSSKGATTFGNVKLSDISWIYFISLSLGSLATILFNQGFTILLGMSILATPVIIYSIYYQYAFAKAWCTLCLIIAAILGVQAAFGIYFFSAILDTGLDASMPIILALIFISVYVIWSTTSVKIKEYLTLKKTKLDYFKFKRNFELFKTMLFKDPGVDYRLSTPASEIVFGNKNAPLSIVIVSSPFCGHCKPVHTMVEEILQSYGDNVSITVRFNVNTGSKENVLYKIIGRLTEIYHEKNPDACLKAMHEIYEGKKPEAWFTTWGDYENYEKYDSTLDSQSQWCRVNNVNFTPHILIEGKAFPKEYDRQDLKLFMDDLIEMSMTKNV